MRSLFSTFSSQAYISPYYCAMRVLSHYWPCECHGLRYWKCYSKLNLFCFLCTNKTLFVCQKVLSTSMFVLSFSGKSFTVYTFIWRNFRRQIYFSVRSDIKRNKRSRFCNGINYTTSFICSTGLVSASMYRIINCFIRCALKQILEKYNISGRNIENNYDTLEIKMIVVWQAFFYTTWLHVFRWFVV